MEYKDNEPNLYTYGLSGISGLFSDRNLGPVPDAAKSARRWGLAGIALVFYQYFTG